MNMIGVQGYTIREHMSTKESFSEALSKIRKIGYTCLDHGVPREMTAAEYMEMLTFHDIKPLKAASDVYAILENPKTVVEEAHILGVDIITVISIPKKMRGNENDYHKYAEDLNRAGGILKKEGLRIAYHNHAFEFCSFGGYTGIDIIINETDDNVEFVPDTHWVAAAGVNPSDFIRKLIGRCTQIHFKDYAIDFGTEVLESVPRLFAEVGCGNLNWPDIVRACRETGIRIFIVEQDKCKIDAFTSLEISYKAIKSLGL